MPEYFSENVLTVSELNGLVKELFDNVPVFSYIKLRGEISNFTNHRSGHFYFTLKDDNAALKAVMFKGSNAKLKFLPENGMRVVATGRLGVFERDGVYQLYVSDLAPDGVGALYIAYEKLKKKLEAEGLFDQSRKKPIPKSITPHRMAFLFFSSQPLSAFKAFFVLCFFFMKIMYKAQNFALRF